MYQGRTEIPSIVEHLAREGLGTLAGGFDFGSLDGLRPWQELTTQGDALSFLAFEAATDRVARVAIVAGPNLSPEVMDVAREALRSALIGLPPGLEDLVRVVDLPDGQLAVVTAVDMSSPSTRNNLLLAETAPKEVRKVITTATTSEPPNRRQDAAMFLAGLTDAIAMAQERERSPAVNTMPMGVRAPVENALVLQPLSDERKPRSRGVFDRPEPAHAVAIRPVEPTVLGAPVAADAMSPAVIAASPPTSVVQISPARMPDSSSLGVSTLSRPVRKGAAVVASLAVVGILFSFTLAALRAGDETTETAVAGKTQFPELAVDPGENGSAIPKQGDRAVPSGSSLSSNAAAEESEDTSDPTGPGTGAPDRRDGGGVEKDPSAEGDLGSEPLALPSGPVAPSPSSSNAAPVPPPTKAVTIPAPPSSSTPTTSPVSASPTPTVPIYVPLPIDPPLNVPAPSPTSQSPTSQVQTSQAPTSQAPNSQAPTTLEPANTGAVLISAATASPSFESVNLSFSTTDCATVRYSVSGGGELASSYGDACVKNHSARLGGVPYNGTQLRPSTAYTITIQATSRSGMVTSKALSFMTTAQPEAPLAIANLRVSEISANTARVSFTANKCVGSSFVVTQGGSGRYDWGFPQTTHCLTDQWATVGYFESTRLQPGADNTVTVSAQTKAGERVTKSITFYVPEG